MPLYSKAVIPGVGFLLAEKAYWVVSKSLLVVLVATEHSVGLLVQTACPDLSASYLPGRYLGKVVSTLLRELQHAGARKVGGARSRIVKRGAPRYTNALPVPRTTTSSTTSSV